MRIETRTFTVLLVLSSTLSSADAGIKSKLLQEAVEAMTRKARKEVAEEGVERLTAKMSSLAAQHGDEVVAQAYKRIGPRVGKLVTEAGEHGDVALHVLGRHGHAALPLVSRKASLRLINKFGQEAEEACIRHGPAVAEPIMLKFGQAGARALKVSEQNGRRLAILAAEGTLKPELIDVVIRHGDKACDFIWRNKGALAGAAALAALIAAPDEVLAGTSQLTAAVLQPLTDVPKAVAVEAAKQVNWTGLGFCGLATLVAVIACLTVRWGSSLAWLKRRAACCQWMGRWLRDVVRR